VESFEQFFTLIGKPLSEGIQFVCSGMWKPYLRVIRERCANAVNISSLMIANGAPPADAAKEAGDTKRRRQEVSPVPAKPPA
jgi:hypothetical protein